MSQVEGSSCTCGRVVAPPRRYCPDCQRGMSPARLEGHGRIETFTTEEVTPEGIEPPVHLSIVRIAEGKKGHPPVRVLARSERPVAVGEKVDLEARGEVLWAERRK